MMNHEGMTMSMWMMPHMIIMLILLFGIVYWATSLALKKYFRNDSLSVIKERYARGEIDEEQYKKMKDTLRS